MSRLFSSGCAAAPLSQESFGLGRDPSLALWCPVELGCRAPRTSHVGGVYPGHCPPQCDAWRSNYVEQLASWPCVDSPAAEFVSGSGADLLTFHLNTFVHVLGNWSGDALRSDGCSALPNGYCSFLYYLRAGCGSNDSLFLCTSSCASSMATASEQNSTLSLGSTATTPLPSSSITFLVNSSFGLGTVQSAIRAVRPSTTILWRTLQIVRRLARDRRFSSTVVFVPPQRGRHLGGVWLRPVSAIPATTALAFNEPQRPGLTHIWDSSTFSASENLASKRRPLGNRGSTGQDCSKRPRSVTS